MIRRLAALSLVTCVSASTSCGGGGSASPQLCALVSACDPNGTTSFGATCDGLGELSNFSNSSTEHLTIQAELSCAQGASDCASLFACLDAPASAVAACKGGTNEVCSGGYAVDCNVKLGGKPQGVNCSAVGLVCGANTNGATCGTASCDVTTTKSSCDGDNLVTCNGAGGVLISSNCAETEGANTCAVVGGLAMCVGDGAKCDATTTPKCDGTAIVKCIGGKTARFDCTTYNSNATCKTSAAGYPQCVGAGTECTAMTSETCKDGVITYCSWGTKMTVDCKSFGLSGCATTPGQGVTYAHCTQ
jgi:hypothetical protein